MISAENPKLETKEEKKSLVHEVRSAARERRLCVMRVASQRIGGLFILGLAVNWVDLSRSHLEPGRAGAGRRPTREITRP